MVTQVPPEAPEDVRKRDRVEGPQVVHLRSFDRTRTDQDPTARKALENLEGPDRVFFYQHPIEFGSALFRYRDEVAVLVKHLGEQTAKETVLARRMREAQEWVDSLRK